MKYQLETIPVHDAWASKSPCPMCSLMGNAEHRHVEYYLGNSVMNPETRLVVNDIGFCSRHFPMMREAGHAHHLGLLAHTHLQAVQKKIKGHLKVLSRNPSSKSAAAFSASIRKQIDGCMICRSMERDLKRYSYTAVMMFGESEEFRELFRKSDGPCLLHASDLADMAAEILKKNELKSFLGELANHLESSLESLEKDVLHFTQKFDSQNDGLEWGRARDAHARTVQALSGRTIRLDD